MVIKCILTNTIQFRKVDSIIQIQFSQSVASLDNLNLTFQMLRSSMLLLVLGRCHCMSQYCLLLWAPHCPLYACHGPLLWMQLDLRQYIALS